MVSRRWIIPALLPALFAVALAATLRAAPPLAVDVGAPGDARFLWGFYDAEAGDGASFRWSGPQARLLLHGAPPGPAVLSLRLSGERPVSQGDPRLTLARGESAFAAFDTVPGWRVYHILLPPGALADRAGQARPLSLRAGVSVPGSSDDGRDYRALGVPLDRLELTPLGGPGWPLARALWLAWALALPAWAAARLPWPGRRPLLIAAFEAALAAGLLAWAARDPYGLAYALPPLPWALGLGTALLAAGPLLKPGRARAAQHSRWWAVAGLAALALAQGLLNSQLAVGAGIGLALAGLLLLLAAPAGLGAGLWTAPTIGLPRRTTTVALGAIFLLALGLRLYRIDSMPFGLWRDEARHGLTALRMAADPSYRPAYVTDLKVQLPGLGLAPFAIALQLLGVHLWTMRLVTALAGALTVFPVYGLVARLTLDPDAAASARHQDRTVTALIAAFFVAISSWQITISRFSFPTIFEPLLAWGGLWLLDRALRPGAGRVGRPPPAALQGLLAGACFGLAAQTYHIGRFAPVMGGLLAAAIVLGRPRPAGRPLVSPLLAAALGCLLVLSPLLLYAVRQPDDFNVRVGAVFVLSDEARQGRAPLAVLDESLGRHLLMFNVRGDQNGRHHAPGRPMLDYVTGMAFLLGMAALLRRLSDWRSLFLLAALALGLLPSALSVDAPHGMRAFEAAPLACAIAALGLGELLRMLKPAPARPLLLGASAALLLALGLNAWLYFAIMPPEREVFLSFYPVQSRMGVYVEEHPKAGRVFVPKGVADDEIFRFLTYRLSVETFDGAQLSSPPRPGDRFLLSGYEADAELAALAPYLGPAPRPTAVGPPFPDRSLTTYFVYEVP